MTEIFRIIGKNDIHFDAGATSNYLFTQGRPPRKLSTILTRQEVLSLLPRLPLGVRPMALKHGLSVITMELNIHGTDDADMEAKEHALIETLVETDVFFSNGGTMGTKAELQVKSDGASEVSFKSVFYGVVDELDARDVLGAVIKSHSMYGLRLTLYCEENWRPGTFNHLFNGGFEFWDRVPYGGTGTDTEPDGWVDFEHVNITGTNNREGATVQQGTYALKINVTNSTGAGQYKGVIENILSRLERGVTYTLIGWIQNTAITAGVLRLMAQGDVSGISYALNSGVANPAYTRFTCQFTPHEQDTGLTINVYIISNGANCVGTAYIDGMMVVRGTLIPDDFIEWHPNPGIRIGPDLLANPGFEEWPADVTDNEPDCWADFELLTDAATGSNNRETTKILQGCYALRVNANVLSLDNYKGVAQDIRTRVVNDTEYVLIAWVKNAAMTPNCAVAVYASGAAMGTRFALNSGNANSNYTRYAVTFTPGAGDANVWIRLLIFGNIGGCTGIAYFDKIMVIKASVYNGHSFAPEEWTGCGYVWNHLDKACNGAGPCHVNYLDLADLRGDVDSRLRIEMESLYYLADTETGVGELTVARRTDPCLPCQFVHFLEAEDATTQENWTDLPLASQSGCNAIGGGVTFTSGHAIWDYTTLGYNLACQKGRFRVLARMHVVYDGAADENVKFRATHGPAAYQQSRWLQPLIEDRWHWLDFGVFEVTGQFWGDELPSTLYWRVDYQKEAADLVYFDFLLLLPEDESVLRILLGEHYLATKDYTAATIAFAATTPGTITDTAAGLAIFETGDKIQVMGSASNDGFYTVSTGGVAGTIRTIEPTVLEALGATVTITSPEDVLWDDTFDFILAVKRSYQDTFVYHPPVQAEPLALKPEEQNRLIFAIGHWISDAFPYKGCLVHEDNDEHMLVSLKYLPQFVSPLE